MKKRKKAKQRREPKGNYVAIDIETYSNVIAYSTHVHYFRDGRSIEIPSAEFPWNLSSKED